MQKYVDTLRLNFRSEPIVNNTNIIEVLRLGQSINKLDNAEGNYIKVSVKTDDGLKEGYVSEKYLREPLSLGREALIHQVFVEWERFNFGLGREHHSPYDKYVGEMWKQIDFDLDGTDRDIPWSAAAISFMVRNAGKALPETKYSQFHFAAAHARYVHDSIKKRQGNDENTPFWGFELHERQPQIGDIVCRGRAGSYVDFQYAAKHHRFKSHCDIIVRVKEEAVVAIGGNVRHSVKRTEYDRTPDGFLDDSKNVYAILVNLHD